MREDEWKPEAKDLEAAIGRGEAALTALLSEAHAADIAECLLELDEEEAWRVFGALDTETGTEVLQRAADPVRTGILERIPVSELVDHVEQMPADDVVDLLALAEDEKSEAVLRAVDFERAQGLRELAAYEPDTAGGLMTTEFVAVQAGTRVGDAIKEIKAEEGPAGEEEVGVFVVDDVRKPIGFVSDRELLTSGIHTPIEEVMETDLLSVHVDDDQEDVAHAMLKYGVTAAPVVDEGGALIGVISSDDVGEVIEEEAEEDILKLVGTSAVEQTRLPVFTRVRHRLPLMALTVLGGLVTARILDYALPSSSDGGSSVGDVLRYLPIIIGLAGNVGIQSSTILVRAFATGEVSQEREATVVTSEVLVGFLIGLLCGGVTTLVAAHLEGAGDPEYRFGSAVGSAIWVAVSWAALLGCLVPLGCKRIGVDPAVAAGPFLITLSDISGAAIFVAVAHLVLEIGV